MTLIKSKFPTWPVFSDFFDDDWSKTRFSSPDWAPAVNVIDNDDNYEIEVAAPGLKKDDFTVHVENGVLTITGKTEKEEEEKKKNFTRREFSSRSFSKAFTLPDNVSEEEVKAKHNDGVLKLTLIKSSKTQPPKKQVAID